MNTKKTALAVATSGVVAGVVGLGILAIPAGANASPPALPEISAEALVQSVVTATVPALAGKVEATESLGLPVHLLPDGIAGATVATDGQGRLRASLPSRRSEKTIVADGTTLWIWDSATRSVTKLPQGDRAGQQRADKQGTGGHTPDGADRPGEVAVDPATLAQDLVSTARQYSDVRVDGTAEVAGRPAYQLVLTPKPTERTLLREVRVAVDAQARIPLRLEVLANGQAEPAVQIGFTEIDVAPQDPGTFTFTPPAGARVTEHADDAHGGPAAVAAGGLGQVMRKLTTQTVGEGWDTVAVAKLPAEVGAVLGGGDGKDDNAGKPGRPARSDRGDVLGMLRQFGTPVDTPFGQAWVFRTKVGTAMVTADGRAAIGAVPEQVLVEAIGQAK